MRLRMLLYVLMGLALSGSALAQNQWSSPFPDPGWKQPQQSSWSTSSLMMTPMRIIITPTGQPLTFRDLNVDASMMKSDQLGLVEINGELQVSPMSFGQFMATNHPDQLMEFIPALVEGVTGTVGFPLSESFTRSAGYLTVGIGLVSVGTDLWKIALVGKGKAGPELLMGIIPSQVMAWQMLRGVDNYVEPIKNHPFDGYITTPDHGLVAFTGTYSLSSRVDSPLPPALRQYGFNPAIETFIRTYSYRLQYNDAFNGAQWNQMYNNLGRPY